MIRKRSDRYSFFFSTAGPQMLLQIQWNTFANALQRHYLRGREREEREESKRDRETTGLRKREESNKKMERQKGTQNRVRGRGERQNSETERNRDAQGRLPVYFFSLSHLISAAAVHSRPQPPPDAILRSRRDHFDRFRPFLEVVWKGLEADSSAEEFAVVDKRV